MSDTKLKVLDLFCGIGGASTGITNASLDVVAAVDHDETALSTYDDNLNHDTIQHDLSEVDLSLLPTEDIDWIHASAPCKGYTTAGSQDEDDPRNSLLFDALEWIREIRPDYITLENVTGLLHMETPEGKDVTDEVHELLQLMGYDTHHEVLNAANYGVAQRRKRVFFFGVQDGNAEDLVPEPTHTQNGPLETLSGRRLREWVGVEEVLSQYDAPREDRYGEPRSGSQAYYEHHPEEPAYTVTGSNGMGPGLYPDGGETYRRFSPEECALFQSMFDYDLSRLNKSEKYDYVGNAVPPLLQQRIAESIRDHTN